MAVDSSTAQNSLGGLHPLRGRKLVNQTSSRKTRPGRSYPCRKLTATSQALGMETYERERAGSGGKTPLTAGLDPQARIEEGQQLFWQSPVKNNNNKGGQKTGLREL